MYISIYAFIKVDIKKERILTKKEEKIANGMDEPTSKGGHDNLT
jgi:hypothetical protein